MEQFSQALANINNFIWQDTVLFVLLGTGILFTIWSRFAQYRAVTHGFHVIRGRYDDPDDPGAINHFQALSAALSATVGLGNIGGVALAIALGGPGAVFWMWVVGFFGMSIKLTEVTLSMLYRNTDNPNNPHGGPMWVASKGFARLKPGLGTLGKVIGSVFCVTLLVSTITGGNMFQAWNVGAITESYFGIPSVASGIVLSILVAMVIIGGIKRIGAVAGRLVPIMVALYLIAGTYVLLVNIHEIPAMFKLIFTSAFSGHEAAGAFLGGSMGYAFLIGMRRALFSNEAGQGSSPIAHSAAKTDEPAREGIVAGLEPFIDTIIVCTFSSLVILSTGVWNRTADVELDSAPSFIAIDSTTWTLESTPIPSAEEQEWLDGEQIFVVVAAGENKQSGSNRYQLAGNVTGAPGQQVIEWASMTSDVRPELVDNGLYRSYVGATLTARAFDTVTPGLGKWLVTMAVWLFAISTVISWSYYGEQGIVFLFGEKAVMSYKVIYCLLIIVATLGLITTDAQLDNLTGIGTGVMLLGNLPIILIFGYQAMRVYRNYIGRLKSGQLGPGHAPPPIEEVISGKDVESIR